MKNDDTCVAPVSMPVLLLSTLLLPSGLQAHCAQTQPSCGMVFSPSEPAAVKYNCKSTSESLISCTFIHLYVWKHQYPSVDEFLATARPRPDAQQCAEASLALADALSKPPAEPAPSRSEARNEQRRLDELKAIVGYCKTGDRESWREYFTREHDQQQKACTLSAQSYVQMFRREEAGPENGVRWITEERPYGACQMHRVAQFKRNGYFWDYSAESKVLNKSAQEGQTHCNEILETEAIFVPDQSEEAGWADCETIRFNEGCSSPNFPCLGPPPAIMF
jgi:hypothetical protein